MTQAGSVYRQPLGIFGDADSDSGHVGSGSASLVSSQIIQILLILGTSGTLNNKTFAVKCQCPATCIKNEYRITGPKIIKQSRFFFFKIIVFIVFQNKEYGNSLMEGLF